MARLTLACGHLSMALPRRVGRVLTNLGTAYCPTCRGQRRITKGIKK
jgi:hypothetical protein